MSDVERRSIKGWAGRLGIPDEPLTLDEVQAFAAIATCDRLLEILTTQQDIQARLTRLELYLAEVMPDYEARSTHRLRAELAAPKRS